DAGDKSVFLADFAKDGATRIGREGQGPEEYLFPRRVFAGLADTTLLYDAGTERFLVIGPDGTPRGTRTLEKPRQSVNVFRFIDVRGRLYFHTRPEGPAGDGVDEHAIRFDPRTGRVDTLARVSLPAGRIEGA